jgi:aminomethyltransferase
MAKYTESYPWHKTAGAKMADFGGWEMPIEYPNIQDEMLFSAPVPLPVAGGVLNEHRKVREVVGLFDVSHLGKIDVIYSGNGEELRDALNRIFTNDLSLINDGEAQYNLILNDHGGVIDDLIIYRISNNHFFLIPNASNCEAVYDRVKAGLKSLNESSQSNQNGAPASGIGFDFAKLTLTNRHNDYAVYAVQGPKANAVLTEFLKENQLPELPNLEYMSFAEYKESSLGRFIICRTGYTGEAGYELVVENKHSLELWKKLATAVINHEGAIVGLGARDTLRTEMGYPLHGHEINEEISPLEGGANWAVKLNKREFLGSKALVTEKENGVKRRLTGLVFDGRTIARAGSIVKDEAGDEVGIVTSGTFSPTLQRGIALALVNRSAIEAVKAGAKLFVDIRGRIEPTYLNALPFVESHTK